MPFGPPCNVCLPPTSLSQVRRVNPNTGEAEIVAIGVRNSVGGDIDPRTGDYWFTENARDWISDDMPSDKLNHIAKIGAALRLSVLPPGRHARPEVRAWATSAPSSRRRCSSSARTSRRSA